MKCVFRSGFENSFQFKWGQIWKALGNLKRQLPIVIDALCVPEANKILKLLFKISEGIFWNLVISAQVFSCAWINPWSRNLAN